MKENITIVLVGNPNVGKTTLLNKIAGKNLKVGNWPGVTVERQEAELGYKNYILHIIDLPGIYNLTPTTDAERVAIDFLTRGNFNVIVNVIDSTSLKRNLLLTLELLELEKPTVVTMNMSDEARKQGVSIDEKELESILGVKTCYTVGKTGEGLEDILKKIVEVYENGSVPLTLPFDKEIEKELEHLSRKTKQRRHDIIEQLRNNPESSKHLEQLYKENIERIISDQRWELADLIVEKTLKKTPRSKNFAYEKLDDLLLHPYLGIVIYLLVFYLIFKISFDFSAPYMDWIDSFFNDFIGPMVTSLLFKLNTPDTVVRFFSEAVIGGVGFIITFAPLIAILYFFITFLEMSGYLTRIAFLMDRFMHKIGLHGNMMTPLLLGFGCNVPAIMAARNLPSKTEKIILTMMIPFMSCPARLVVFAFFAFVFFKNPALVIVSLYFIGIAVAFVTALLLRNTFLKGEASNFVLELPPYRFPSFKIVFSIVWAHTKEFLYKAGSFIFIVSIIVWTLLNIPSGSDNPDKSLAATIGKSITPIFQPIGLGDWRATTSLIPGFLAREVVLSSMGVIYKTSEIKEEKEEIKFHGGKEVKKQFKNLLVSIKDSFLSVVTLGITTFEVESYQNDPLRESVRKSFTTASAYSFMILLLIYNSCVATVAVMIKEIGKKYSIYFLIYSFAAAWLLAFVAYNVLTFMEKK